MSFSTRFLQKLVKMFMSWENVVFKAFSTLFWEQINDNFIYGPKRCFFLFHPIKLSYMIKCLSSWFSTPKFSRKCRISGKFTFTWLLLYFISIECDTFLSHFCLFCFKYFIFQLTIFCLCAFLLKVKFDCFKTFQLIAILEFSILHH